MAKRSTKYSDNLETLIALTIHLAQYEKKSRTPRMLAKYTSLNYEDVRFVVKNFKGLFRESIGVSKHDKDPEGNKEHFYWLQIRYARWYLEGKRDEDNPEDEGAPAEPLPPEYLVALLDFIAKMVEQEKTESRQVSANIVAIVASIIALVAAIGAAIIALLV